MGEQGGNPAGEIVFQEERKGKQVVIRYPLWQDLHGFMALRNKLDDEQVMASHQHLELPRACDLLGEILKRLVLDQQRMLFVFIDGKLVGEASATRNYNPDYAVVGLALAPEARGLGLGRLLMQLLEDECRKLGREKAYLTVWGENTVAVDLYRKLGWQDVGCFPDWEEMPDGSRSDLLHMIKDLSRA